MLDDFSYVTKDQAETSVLFELISARYEHRSLLLTANQPFGQWDKIFPDPAMTVAAIDRLVHRATIFELNVESYRRRTAIDHKRSRQRAAASAGEGRRPDRWRTAPDRYVTVRSDHGFDQRPAPTALSTAPPGQRNRRCAIADLRTAAPGRNAGRMRWRTLLELQDEYQAWLDNLPDNLTESVLAHKLEAICMLDLAELESIEPPRGFGRD